jgi:hypothetical protein
VEAQDVEPIIFGGHGIPLPVRLGTGGDARARGVAEAAVDFERDGQHDICRGSGDAATAGHHVHQGIRV